MDARNFGFSLLEVAIVLIIIGLLLITVIPSLNILIEFRRFDETKNKLVLIQDALINFAVLNKKLPCPATLNSGGFGNNNQDGTCPYGYYGYIPAADLALNETNNQGLVVDAWGRPIKYAVTQKNSYAYTLSDGVKNNINNNLKPDLSICASYLTGSSTCFNSQIIIKNVPAVVYSSGKNGIFESYLNDNSTTFLYHEPTAKDSPLGEFDDQLLWISNSNLIGRMAQTW